MQRLDALAKHFSGRKVIAVLSVIVVLHLLMMAFYVNDGRLARRTARRDAVIQKIVNVINLIYATPVPNREQAVSAISDPDMSVSITDSPKWERQFDTVSYWEINRALRQQLERFALSIKLGSDHWLNINGTADVRIFLRLLFFFSIEILIFGSIILAVWSITRFTRPLEDFRRSVESLGVDLHTRPVEIVGPAAVRETAEAINQMQQRIQDLIRDRTQMLAAISHDLRTPITRLKLRAQFLEDSESKAHFVSDLDEMDAMINETLSFARNDALSEEKVRFDLVSLLGVVCDGMVDLGHAVSFSSRQRQLPVLGRRLALKRALTNLVGNAVRYGKNVEVSIGRQHQFIVIRIEDDGPGILEKDLPHVFEPFYRAESSRSRDTGGVGLGLAVARDIVKAHQGDIVLKNRSKGGLSVVVQLLA